MPKKNKYTVITDDSIVHEVIKKYDQRSFVGTLKYGATLDRDDLNTVLWIDHAIEELMDATLYLTRLKRDLKNGLRTGSETWRDQSQD